MLSSTNDEPSSSRALEPNSGARDLRAAVIHLLRAALRLVTHKRHPRQVKRPIHIIQVRREHERLLPDSPHAHINPTDSQVLEQRVRVQNVALHHPAQRARERRARRRDVRGRGRAPRDAAARAVVDRERGLDDELAPGGDAAPVLGRAEALGHGPERLGARPALGGAARGELVHARGDVEERALAVVAAAVAEVGRARRVLL